jgi:hypothetical protein
MLVATPEEQKVLDQLAKAEDGSDPFGDEDDLEVLNETDDQDIDPENPDDETETAKTQETTEAKEEPEVQQAQIQEPTGYKAEVPQEYKSQRAELLKSKAEAMKKLMDGEIGAEEFAQEDARIADALEELTAQRIRAETLIEANQQLQAQTQQKALQKLISQTKDQIDYLADPKAQKQFDMALNTMGADPDNAGRDYADLIAEAHKVVCALRGIPVTKGEQVAQAVQQTANRRPKEAPPVTLRNIPAASTPNANGDMLDQMGRLSGPAYEEAFNRLTPAQRKSLLDEE